MRRSRAHYVGNMSEPVRATRLVYKGGPVSGAARIKAVKVVKAPEDSNIDVVSVPNFAHYESGCRQHSACFGHYCRTPGGILLPPQSLSMRTGKITTEYLKASRYAFEGRKEEYLESLEKTNLTKEGTMQSMMSTPVAGSARLIATPMWYRRELIWISKNLADKYKVCYTHFDEDGIMDPVYRERTLEEGDYVMLIRPPPLNIWNTQPMKIRFWNNDCIGVHPETFTMLHGDFDGDEAHLMALLHPLSIQECEAWSVPSNEKFDEGREEYIRDNNILETDEDYWHRCEFMNTTTVSSGQMSKAVMKAAYGNISRNKDSNLKTMHDRFNSEDTERDFVAQSIRGMKDVCKQQLSQGLIGYMTRVAKNAAMCFTRPASGGLYVATNSGTIKLCDDDLCDPGVPAVRAVMSLCEVAQQAALDSHRVQEGDMASHDFISDLFLHRPVLEPKGKKLPTLIVFEKNTSDVIIAAVKPIWKFRTDDGVAVLCQAAKVAGDIALHVVGAYSPQVVAGTEKRKYTAQQLCYKGISAVCSYYKVRLTPIELNDLSYLMSFRIAWSTDPITTRKGLVARSLSWIETMEATETNVSEMKTDWQKPFSSTSSMFMANFSRMVIGDTT